MYSSMIIIIRLIFGISKFNFHIFYLHVHIVGLLAKKTFLFKLHLYVSTEMGIYRKYVHFVHGLLSKFVTTNV